MKPREFEEIEVRVKAIRARGFVRPDEVWWLLTRCEELLGLVPSQRRLL